MKEIAPSDDLRRWFHANPDAWDRFASGYEAELAEQDALLRELAEYAQDGVVTLLYASKDETHNNAIVLQDTLRRWLKREGQGDV